ncbi:hypothetical protein [Neptuniibacter halophilus]|uniref:hypothetical protein n=1 Tax=Neptuniibacter halophilus TaxID=651666 RepID=UPI002572FB2E|nr:hypothetical protein [Neptuniibacter halophilus]
METNNKKRFSCSGCLESLISSEMTVQDWQQAGRDLSHCDYCKQNLKTKLPAMAGMKPIPLQAQPRS